MLTEKIAAGQEVASRTNKTQRQKDARLATLLERYAAEGESADVRHFLRGCAHNISYSGGASVPSSSVPAASVDE